MSFHYDFPIDKIISLKGMIINSYELLENDQRKAINIHLKRDSRFSISHCSNCGREAPRNRRITKVVRDLPIISHDTILVVKYLMSIVQIVAFTGKNLILLINVLD
ncbi:hypothetical protein HY750_03785 [Candidatus Kuenenbacteria bacterium]|nr:hypothetical protein [Candidatus Kuenenbacteria bacterium]